MKKEDEERNKSYLMTRIEKKFTLIILFRKNEKKVETKKFRFDKKEKFEEKKQNTVEFISLYWK